jgi:hypothetical protein
MSQLAHTLSKAVQKKGGPVPKKASPSAGKTRDDVKASLTAGEFVVPRVSVQTAGPAYWAGQVDQTNGPAGPPPVGHKPPGRQKFWTGGEAGEGGTAGYGSTAGGGIGIGGEGGPGGSSGSFGWGGGSVGMAVGAADGGGSSSAAGSGARGGTTGTSTGGSSGGSGARGGGGGASAASSGAGASTGGVGASTGGSAGGTSGGGHGYGGTGPTGLAWHGLAGPLGLGPGGVLGALNSGYPRGVVTASPLPSVDEIAARYNVSPRAVQLNPAMYGLMDGTGAASPSMNANPTGAESIATRGVFGGPTGAEGVSTAALGHPGTDVFGPGQTGVAVAPAQQTSPLATMLARLTSLKANPDAPSLYASPVAAAGMPGSMAGLRGGTYGTDTSGQRGGGGIVGAGQSQSPGVAALMRALLGMS